tara:strand:+ start:119 stop:292 length:174 start_codon:yes stop_codon:yes gene_type:complete
LTAGRRDLVLAKAVILESLNLALWLLVCEKCFVKHAKIIMLFKTFKVNINTLYDRGF